MPVLPNVALVLGTIFIVLRLDHRIMWPWLLVFIPFAVPLFHLLFALISYDLIRWIFGSEVHANLNGTLGEHTGQVLTLAAWFPPSHFCFHFFFQKLAIPVNSARAMRSLTCFR